MIIRETIMAKTWGRSPLATGDPMTSPRVSSSRHACTRYRSSPNPSTTANSTIRISRITKQEFSCNLSFSCTPTRKFFQLTSPGPAAGENFSTCPLQMNLLGSFSYCYRKKLRQCWYWKETKAWPTKWVRLKRKELSEEYWLLRTILQSLMNSIFLGRLEKRSYQGRGSEGCECGAFWSQISAVPQSYSYCCQMRAVLVSSMIYSLLKLQQREMDLTMAFDFSSPSFLPSTSRQSFSLESTSLSQESLPSTQDLTRSSKQSSKCFRQKNSDLFRPSPFFGKSRTGILLTRTVYAYSVWFLAEISLCQACFPLRQIRKKTMESTTPTRKRISVIRMTPGAGAVGIGLGSGFGQRQYSHEGYRSKIWQKSLKQNPQPAQRERMRTYPSAALRMEKKTATPGANLNSSQLCSISIVPSEVPQHMGIGSLSILSRQQGQTTGISPLRSFLNPNLAACRWSSPWAMLAGKRKASLLRSTSFRMDYSMKETSIRLDSICLLSEVKLGPPPEGGWGRDQLMVTIIGFIIYIGQGGHRGMCRGGGGGVQHILFGVASMRTTNREKRRRQLIG